MATDESFVDSLDDFDFSFENRLDAPSNLDFVNYCRIKIENFNKENSKFLSEEKLKKK